MVSRSHLTPNTLIPWTDINEPTPCMELRYRNINNKNDYDYMYDNDYMVPDEIIIDIKQACNKIQKNKNYIRNRNTVILTIGIMVLLVILILTYLYT